MKIILNGKIDCLNFKNKETICSTHVIRTTHSIITQLMLLTYSVHALSKNI
jgi:hypothetical protein